MSGGAVIGIALKVAPGLVAAEAAEIAFEKATGLPAIVGPDDILEAGIKRGLRKVCPTPKKVRTKKVRPTKGAGSHTGFKRDPQTGKITGHTTFDENGFPTQRTDITGKPHNGVKPPHTHVYHPPNRAPDGTLYPGGESGIRPATPIEIPRNRVQK